MNDSETLPASKAIIENGSNSDHVRSLQSRFWHALCDYFFLNAFDTEAGKVIESLKIKEYLDEAAVSFTVTYNNGGGTGTAVTITYTTSSPNATTDGTATGATPGGFTRTGYTFKGWATRQRCERSPDCRQGRPQAHSGLRQQWHLHPVRGVGGHQAQRHPHL